MKIKIWIYRYIQRSEKWMFGWNTWFDQDSPTVAIVHRSLACLLSATLLHLLTLFPSVSINWCISKIMLAFVPHHPPLR